MSAQSMTMRNANSNVQHGILYVSCGTPGAGKSTWLNTYRAEDEHVVSRDAIRYSLLQEGEAYFSHEDEVFHDFIYAIKDLINSGSNVYADATHLNEKSRGKLLFSLRQIGCTPTEINAIYFPTNLNTCIIQNNKRKGTIAYVPEIQLRQMFFKMTPPTYKEGFNHIFIVDTKTGKVSKARK